jgi:hypothetical protein
MVFNATLKICYIVAVSFISGEYKRKPLTCRKSLTNLITSCCNEYISPERESNSR